MKFSLAIRQPFSNQKEEEDDTVYKNGLRYGGVTTLVCLTHLIMLAAIFFRGNYTAPSDLLPLTVAVLGLDFLYTIILRFCYRQMTYTLDFLLLLLMNVSVIFQSCFGGVGFAAKRLNL